MVAVVDPTAWIVAACAAAGVLGGVWKFATRRFATRRAKVDREVRLYRDMYGWPAIHDEDGNVVEKARPGALTRIQALEG